MPAIPASPDMFCLVLEFGDHLRAQTAEVIAGVEEEMLIQAVRPVDVRVEAERVCGVDEAEEIDVVGADALEVEVAIELIALAQRFVEARLQAVLVTGCSAREFGNCRTGYR